MYPDSLLFFILPFALYVGLTFVPKAKGTMIAAIAAGAALVFLLASVARPYRPNFDLDGMFEALFAAGLLSAAIGALAYHRLIRDRQPTWLWRGAGLLIGIGAMAILFFVLAEANL